MQLISSKKQLWVLKLHDDNEILLKLQTMGVYKETDI